MNVFYLLICLILATLQFLTVRLSKSHNYPFRVINYIKNCNCIIVLLQFFTTIMGKCWHTWAKQTLSTCISVLPQLQKTYMYFVDSQILSLPFQCWNRLCGHCHMLITLKRGEGVKMWKLEIEKLTRSTKQVFFRECLFCFCPQL